MIQISFGRCKLNVKQNGILKILENKRRLLTESFWERLTLSKNCLI